MPPASTMSAALVQDLHRARVQLAVSLCRKKGSGTPQLRWRLMHQSGRLAIMSRSRARPFSG
jgi:hypothetical protein